MNSEFGLRILRFFGNEAQYGGEGGGSLLIGLNCKGMEHFTHRTGGPIAVPQASRKTSNGNGTDQNGFFLAVPLQREKRPIERVPLVEIVFFLLICRVLFALCCVKVSSFVVVLLYFCVSVVCVVS